MKLGPEHGNMVISVPHSGTRSLCRYLDPKTGHSFSYWHFGQNDPDIDIFEGHTHIPIRHPVDIAISWDARYATEETKSAEDMLTRLERMLAFIKSHRVTLYRIEDLPRYRRSRGPDSDIRETRDSERIRKLRRWLTDDKLTFYQQFYKVL